MSVIVAVPEPNIWEEICKDLARERPPFRDEDQESIETNRVDYDPSGHHPVFYGKLHEKVDVDTDTWEHFDPSQSHPAALGYVLLNKPPKLAPPTPPPSPPKKTCSPREYLEHYVFPVLLPALEGMLKAAKQERCFERKRTKFNALDYLTEYLYKNNPDQTGREEMELGDIPFVKEWWKDHPRPPLPKSLLWTEEEASLIVQSFWKGYKERCDPEVQEMREWHMKWREENDNISRKVSDFWAKQMPDGDMISPNASEEILTDENKDIKVKSPESAT